MLFYIELNGGRVLGVEITWRSDASTNNFSANFVRVGIGVVVVCLLKSSRRGGIFVWSEAKERVG